MMMVIPSKETVMFLCVETLHGASKSFRRYDEEQVRATNTRNCGGESRSGGESTGCVFNSHRQLHI